MKCYIHHGEEALGICKSCNKGLCSDCAIDVGNGIACKNSCEQAVHDINEMILKSKGIYQKTSGAYYRAAAIYSLFGLVFVIYSYFNSILASLLLPISIIFFVGMIFTIYSGMKMSRKEEST